MLVVQTCCGEYELNIIGAPEKLLIVPIKFYYGIDLSLLNLDYCSNICDVQRGTNEGHRSPLKEDSRRV